MSLKVLVAEDSATMRKIVEMTFAGEDVEVLAVEDGQSALSRARDWSPDVLLADTSLPGMDGYELIAAFRSDAALADRATILMTSHAHPYDAARGAAVGSDDHVVKPFDTQALIDKVMQAHQKRAGQRSSLSEGAARAIAAPSASMLAGANASLSTAPPPAAPQSPASPSFSAPPAHRADSAMPISLNPISAPPAPPVRHHPSLKPQGERAGVQERSESASTGNGSRASLQSPRVPSTPLGRTPTQNAPRPGLSRQPEARSATTRSIPPAAELRSASSGGGEISETLKERIQHLGLSAAQLEAVVSLSREVIYEVVWEVVPELAETLVREEIRRLTAAPARDPR